MAVTQAQIDALDAAIAAGELTVRSREGAMVTYRSVGDLLRAREALAAQLVAQQVAQGEASPRRRIFRLYHAGRGF